MLLLRAIDHLYRKVGVYQGQPSAYPTLADVRDYLLAYKAKGREASWMESALRAAEVLCFGDMGTTLNEPPFVDIARILDNRVVLELDALTNADKTFLIESLLLWIHHYRLGQPQREDFKHAIFIEEAHHILLRKKQEATGEEAVTDVLLREIRELGEAVIVLDQHPSLISKPAPGNTYTTFAFNLKHRGDIPPRSIREAPPGPAAVWNPESAGGSHSAAQPAGFQCNPGRRRHILGPSASSLPH